MKVIVAGSSKTGAKSLSSAFKELGYRVYDSMEHLLYHYDNWIEIFEGYGDSSNFERMYENVDVVVDAPAFLYWYEIHRVFPDAKVRPHMNKSVFLLTMLQT